MKYGKKEIKFLFFAVIFSYVCASLLHFSYDFLGRLPIFAGLMPVSESIWEHLKLVFYPICVVFLLPWHSLVKVVPFKNRAIIATLTIIMGKLLVFMGYYGLKEGLLIDGIVSDCLLLLAALTLGACFWFFLRKYTFPTWAFPICCIYLFVDVLLFYIYSFWPPDLPIFQPPIG